MEEVKTAVLDRLDELGEKPDEHDFNAFTEEGIVDALDDYPESHVRKALSELAEDDWIKSTSICYRLS